MDQHEVQTRQQFWGQFEPKEAEVSGTPDMPMGAAPGKKPDKGAKFAIPKVASVEGAPEGVESSAVAGEQPPQNPQAKQINPRVNVSGKEATKPAMAKKASTFALPSAQRYPLDSYSDVEKAAAYFDEWGAQFSPAQRHEFCENLTKRAHALDIPLSPMIEKYGSAVYAPSNEIAVALDGRKGVLTDEDHRLALEKLAELRPTVEPGFFAEALSEFDKMAGIDFLYGQDILDPFLSTYGVKLAQDDDSGSTVIGNDVVSHKSLKRLTRTPCLGCEQLFGEDFVKEFKKDPISIFSSLPVDQKKIVARMADDVDVDTP
jgi:hypothetical protein